MLDYYGNTSVKTMRIELLDPSQRVTFMIRKKLKRKNSGKCRFCTKEGCPRPAFVDYKDVPNLKKLCTPQGKLFSRKRSGTCSTFQRVSAWRSAARFMALMPYVGE